MVFDIFCHETKMSSKPSEKSFKFFKPFGGLFFLEIEFLFRSIFQVHYREWFPGVSNASDVFAAIYRLVSVQSSQTNSWSKNHRINQLYPQNHKVNLLRTPWLAINLIIDHLWSAMSLFWRFRIWRLPVEISSIGILTDNQFFEWSLFWSLPRIDRYEFAFVE